MSLSHAMVFNRSILIVPNKIELSVKSVSKDHFKQCIISRINKSLSKRVRVMRKLSNNLWFCHHYCESKLNYKNFYGTSSSQFVTRTHVTRYILKALPYLFINKIRVPVSLNLGLEKKHSTDLRIKKQSQEVCSK